MPGKEHTTHRFDASLSLTRRSKDFLLGQRRLVDKDSNDRMGWLDRRAHFQRRRYGLEWRNPSFPWVGSSDIVLPLIDKSIDQLKPEFVSLVTGARPPVTVSGIGQNARNESNVELWFQWLLESGSPNFIREVILATDDLLEMGRGILQTFWKWETSPAPETLRRSHLPPRLRRLIAVKTQREADEIQAANQLLGTQAAVITVKEFEGFEDQIREMLEREYDLSKGESSDARALNQIVEWLKTGAREPLTILKRDVRVDAPAVVAVSPIDFIVPETTTEIEDAERLTQVITMGATELRRAARDNGFNLDAVDFVVDASNKKRSRGGHSLASARNDYIQDNADREGMSRADDMEFEIYKSCLWFSDGPGKPDFKAIALYHPDHPDKPFKFIRYQRPSGRWPYHTGTFELNKRRWHSPRGIPEIIDDLEQELTLEHRAKINRMSIVNAPTFAYRANSRINPETFHWVPGQMFPVPDPSRDIVPLQVPSLDVSFDREEQILRTWAEERLGATDFGLANPLSSLTEARTATEIEQIQARSDRALSLRGTLFQGMMEQVYEEFFQMWHAFGPREVWVRLFDDAEPVRVTKEELQGEFVFSVTAEIGATNPQREGQRALLVLQTLLQLQQAGAVGDQFELNLGEAMSNWLEQTDRRLARRVVRRRTPQEVKQIQQERKRRQDLMDAAESNIPLEPRELQEAAKLLESRSPKRGAQQVRLGA